MTAALSTKAGERGLVVDFGVGDNLLGGGQGQHVGQQRNVQGQVCQGGPRGVGNGKLFAIGQADQRVVVDDKHIVERCVHIQFDVRGALVNGVGEGQ